MSRRAGFGHCPRSGAVMRAHIVGEDFDEGEGDLEKLPVDELDEFDPDEEVPRVLVGVEGAVFELWLQP